MEPQTYVLVKPHLLSLSFLSKHQHELIKSLVVNMDNDFNEVFLSFDPLNSEFVPGVRIIDTFSSCFSFHIFSKYNKDSLKSQVQQLDEMAIESLNFSSSTLVITDASVKNNIATSISYVHIHNKPITKTHYHTINVMSAEAELFIIRCSINQATNSGDISKIIVITNAIHTTRKIFDPLSYPFQRHSASILKELQNFFSRNQENLIEFWECPSYCNWSLHKVVDKETKLFNPILLFPYKSS